MWKILNISVASHLQAEPVPVGGVWRRRVSGRGEGLHREARHHHRLLWLRQVVSGLLRPPTTTGELDVRGQVCVCSSLVSRS